MLDRDLLAARGPDGCASLERNNIFVTHYHLAIESKTHMQPYNDDNLTIVFNGEIYNYRELSNQCSEVETIREVYLDEGIDGLKKLDGEFAIAIFDWRRSEIIVVMDEFATKPLYWSVKGMNYIISTFPSIASLTGLEPPIAFSPNKIAVLEIETGLLKWQVQKRLFMLRQYKTSFDDWCNSLEISVKKRVQHGCGDVKRFIGLSSGYDSGAIHAACAGMKLAIDTISIIDSQNEEIINRRNSYAGLNSRSNIKIVRERNVPSTSCHFKRIENLTYSIYSSQGDYFENQNMFADRGAIGLYHLCERASADGYKIMLSGTGADEITCDYGFKGRRIYSHSNFGGDYPTNIESIFPWPSFYGSSMRTYLLKEEFIAGSFGIETRYPFLDGNVVQEFLNLSVNLKNQFYKAPLKSYLDRCNYPYEENVKIGF